MERLMVLKLAALECEAEALFNGIPLARVDAGRPRAIVPVHEYAIAGANRLELVIWPRPASEAGKPAPPPEPQVSNGQRLARAAILLPRMGNPIDESSARTLAELQWAPPQGTRYEAPLSLSHEVALPVSFPRWRWMDAPPLELRPELSALALGFVQTLAEDLARGETSRFLAATRLRTEELATAYQCRPEEETQRLRDHLLALHTAGSLQFQALAAEAFSLRPIAGSRLFECLDAEGLPALRTQPDEQGHTLALPLRITVVDGKVYVLR